jgi:hypothetical protein
MVPTHQSGKSKLLPDPALAILLVASLWRPRPSVSSGRAGAPGGPLSSPFRVQGDFSCSQAPNRPTSLPQVARSSPSSTQDYPHFFGTGPHLTPLVFVAPRVTGTGAIEAVYLDSWQPFLLKRQTSRLTLDAAFDILSPLSTCRTIRSF